MTCCQKGEKEEERRSSAPHEHRIQRLQIAKQDLNRGEVAAPEQGREQERGMNDQPRGGRLRDGVGGVDADLVPRVRRGLLGTHRSMGAGALSDRRETPSGAQDIDNPAAFRMLPVPWSGVALGRGRERLTTTYPLAWGASR